MQINKIMTTGVATCQPDTDLAAVAKLMWDHDCGIVPVVDAAGRVAGVVTDRDICIASATRGLPPERISAAQAMNSPVRACLPGDTIADALAEMKRFQVRRVPVIAADGTLQGIVSLNDIVRASGQKQGPTPAEIVSTLTAICAHRVVTAAAA